MGESSDVNAAWSAPEALALSHQLEGFDCGEASLNDWLTRRAMTNHLSGASRTFVVTHAQRQVIGYYALAAGAVAHRMVGSSVRRNMPDPVPVMVLARLVVDRRAQGFKLGAGLLQDALIRVQGIAQQAGVRALVVHALNEPAKRFYEHYGFVSSPIDSMTLMVRLKVPLSIP